MKSQIFVDIECTTSPAGACVCGDEERALRRIADGTYPHVPMTPDQREWCIQEADSAGEGAYSRAELEKLGDAELADTTLRAWWMYAQSNCM